MAASSRFVLPYQSVFNAAGVPIVGALLNFYISQTDTRLNTFSNPGLTVPNANPVVALDNGLFPNIFLTPGVAYKVVLTDALANEIWTADPVESPISAADTIYPAAFEFLGGTPPRASETMGMHYLTSDVNFPANWGAASGFFRAPATATFTATIVNQLASSLGTMVVASGQRVPTFTTPGGATLSLTAGETIIFIGPASPDATLADGAWTLPGALA